MKQTVITNCYSLEDLQPYFLHPIAEAALLLHVRVSELRVICKELGIIRWPYNKNGGQKLLKMRMNLYDFSAVADAKQRKVKLPSFAQLLASVPWNSNTNKDPN